MKKTVFRVVLMTGVLAMWGCATIVGGTDQAISVDSNVKDADVIFNGTKVGVTPFNGQVKKVKDPSLMVKKDGYVPSQQVLSTTTPTIFWGNILIGGTLGSTTDYATGAMFEVSPKSYYINLQPVSTKTSYDFKKDTLIKKYSMLNYPTLTNELSAGQGEYLDALLTRILDVAPESRTGVIEQLRSLVKRSKNNAIRFGEGVADLYFSSLQA